MKNIVAFAVISTILLAACNKDQKTVNKLDGVWNVTAASVNGSTVSYGQIGYDSIITMDEMNSFNFIPCKIKDDSCVGAMTGIYQDFIVTIPPDLDTVINVTRAVTYPYTYIVSDKGDKLNLWVQFASDSIVEKVGAIKEFKKGTMIVEFDENGRTTELTMEKRTNDSKSDSTSTGS